MKKFLATLLALAMSLSTISVFATEDTSVELPTATTTQLDVSEIGAVDLTFAMNFTADVASSEQLEAYGDWYADFVLTVNKEVTFNADGSKDGYLAGQYDTFGADWLKVPGEDVTLPANTPLRIMAKAAELTGNNALKITCNDIYNFVNDFDCGVYFDDEFIAENPDLKATLELRFYNNEDETESYIVGETYDFEITPPTATTSELDVAEINDIDLTFAMNFTADGASDAQMAVYGDWYADFVLTVNKEVTFNADGSKDGYLAGQYDTFGADWLKVPGEDVTLPANTPLRIMAKAAELTGNNALKITCNDIYNFVNNFDCGVYFNDAFVAENPDLKATLELRFYNNEDETESYLVGETYDFEITLPTATTEELDVDEINNVDLTFAMNFTADAASDAQMAVYGDWYADFVLTVNKEVTFNADGTKDGYLAGQYDTFGADWLKVPGEDVTLPANTPLRIMAKAAELTGNNALKITCNDIYNFVNDFDCGVFFTDEFLLANPDLKATLELRFYDNEDETKSYLVGETYGFEALPTATTEELDVDEIDNVDLTFAMNFTADEASAAQMALYGDWYADFVLTVNKPVTFNADGTKDGYLAGQYDTFGADWLKVPGEDVTLPANTPLRIMAKAAELTGNNALKITCNDIYNFVNDFDCGVYFDEDFLGANPGLKATLELRFYNNEDETKSYLVGETYSFEVPVVSQPGGGMGGIVTTQYCTVKFDTNGGSAVESQKIEKNSKITEPKAPTKEGYTFDGWYTDKKFVDKYDFLSYVTSSFTLYAKLVANDSKEDDKKDDEEAKSDLAFGDVAQTAWYYDDVKYVVENGLMKGVSDNDFAPNGLLTRAMLVTILYRNAGEPAVNRSIPFGDIDLGSYYANAVIWAQQNGIVNGYSDTEFAPDANITREQIAAIILRYAQYKGYDVSIGEDIQLADFDDFGAVHEYAIPAVKYAIGMKIINGKTDRTINPRDNATRAEIAAILHRFIESNK